MAGQPGPPFDIDLDRGVTIGRGGMWTDVPNSRDPAWMQNGVVREWQAMTAVIIDDRDVPVTGDYGRQMIAGIDAAMISARERRDVDVTA